MPLMASLRKVPAAGSTVTFADDVIAFGGHKKTSGEPAGFASIRNRPDYFILSKLRCRISQSSNPSTLAFFWMLALIAASSSFFDLRSVW